MRKLNLVVTFGNIHCLHDVFAGGIEQLWEHFTQLGHTIVKPVLNFLREGQLQSLRQAVVLVIEVGMNGVYIFKTEGFVEAYHALMSTRTT